MKRKIVLIMGAYNPPTKAHVKMGEVCREAFPDAEICFVPSGEAYLTGWKNLPKGSMLPQKERIRLLQEAVGPEYLVSDVESDPEKSDGKTIHTALWFAREYEKVILCIGEDNLAKLGKWYRAGDLLSNFSFAVICRGHRAEEMPDILPEDLQPYRDGFTFLDFPYSEVSSTKVREAFWAGDDAALAELVPGSVAAYLKAHGDAYQKEGVMYNFDAEKATAQCLEWIRAFFEENGPGCNAVLGISGGKDSTVAAALCAEALGKDRVIGVLMPNGVQPDIDVSKDVVATLGIRAYEINIASAFDGLAAELEKAGLPLTSQARINLPPRLRMSTVYAVSQCNNGRVVNTCNLSEDWVGYSTRYGDAAGDFSPMAGFTVAEVKAVGRVLGVPDRFLEKAPSDGLSGKTDEDNLGFTYAVLDRYIRTGEIDDPEIKAKIDRKHEMNLFKMKMMPQFRWM